MKNSICDMFLEWNRGLSSLMGERYSPEFPNQMMQVLVDIVPTDDPLALFVFVKGQKPSIIFDHMPVGEQKERYDKYIEYFYMLDPCYRESKENRVNGYCHFAKLVEEGFAESEVFRSHYKRNIIDEMGFVIRLDGESFVNISAVRIEKPVFQQEEKSFYRSVEPLVSRLVRDNLSFNVDRFSGGTDSKHQYMEKVLESFGRNILTDKEYEVMQLLLRGHSMKFMAERLHRSIDSIKKYHSSIYQKLNISSQRELMPLFIGAVELYPEFGSGDSLELYLNKHHGSTPVD